MRALILSFFAVSEVCRALANPVVIDPERQPVAMLSEKVEISVGEGKSRVSGKFRFEQQTSKSKKHTHVTIFVPVFLPDTLATRSYEGLYGPPDVEVCGHRFSAEAWNDIALEGAPDSIRLPRGWSTTLYVCEVPLRILAGKDFEANVTYMQPHFPKDIAGYVPIRPPRDKTASEITFAGEPGRELRRVSWPLFLARKTSALRFVPSDRRLILVQSLKGRG